MDSKREVRAIDALLVSQLRSDRESVDSLPELNELEREALNSLGADFVDRLLAGEVREVDDSEVVIESEEIACGPAFGMNRAKDIDEVTRLELDAKRQEIIDSINQNKRGADDADIQQ
jgi:hypothetical protein